MNEGRKEEIFAEESWRDEEGREGFARCCIVAFQVHKLNIIPHGASGMQSPMMVNCCSTSPSSLPWGRGAFLLPTTCSLTRIFTLRESGKDG